MTESESVALLAKIGGITGGGLALILYLSKVIKAWQADRSETAVQKATNDAIAHWKAASEDAEARCQKLVADLAEMTQRANNAERDKQTILAERSAMEQRLTGKISELEFRLDGLSALLAHLHTLGRLEGVPADLVLKISGQGQKDSPKQEQGNGV